MIVVDASAVVAIYLGEAERRQFSRRIKESAGAIISPVGYWEALARAQAVHGDQGRTRMARLVTRLGVRIVVVDASQADLAADAFARFGKRTPAKLNMGDCFAYALAKQCNAPLLYKGDDFAKTDIGTAV